MKNTMRKLAAVLVCAGMLGNTSVTATGIPVFDGAAMTNAFHKCSRIFSSKKNV